MSVRQHSQCTLYSAGAPVSLGSGSCSLCSRLAKEEVLMDSPEVADMAEVRKAFQIEREHIRQKMDAFRTERSEHRTHGKAFRDEKEVISYEREAIRLEETEMAMLRKAY
ncbi:unnamed protein product [Merluccius merluccius]